MLAEERRDRIMREVNLRGRVDVQEFAARTGHAGMTIRRDLAVLAERGLIRRVHGGGVPIDSAAAPSSVRRVGGSQPLATVGLVVPSARYYYPEIIRGAQNAARGMRFRIVLSVSEYSPHEEERQLDRLVRAGVDAVVLATADPGTGDRAVFDQAARIGLPMVLLERSAKHAPPGLPLDAVRSDHHFGALLALDHLASRGYRKVALVARVTPTARWITSGFAESAAAAGVEAGPVLECANSPGADRVSVAEFSRRAIAEGVDAMLVLPDELAMVVLGALADLGVRVPDEMGVVAYDDEVAALASIPLTAVAPPKRELGERAMALVQSRLRAAEQPAMQRIKMTPVLSPRESTRAARPPG